MSSQHGGPIKQKSISELAEYIKIMIPENISESYKLKPMFEKMASAGDIRRGVRAYRDFLILLCDKLISDGHLYFSTKKNPQSPTDYPFLYILSDLLSDIGYHGQPGDGGTSFSISSLPSFIPTIDDNGNRTKPGNSIPKLMDSLRFLAFCGVEFYGIDLAAKKISLSKERPLKAVYPAAPQMLTGLKALSIADRELRERRYKSDNKRDNLLRCDYRLLKAEDTEVIDVLKDYAKPLTDEVQSFVLKLHNRFTDLGMTCSATISTFETHFAYSDLRSSRKVFSPKEIYQKRMWEFALDTRNGYCLVVKAGKTDRYAETINKFPTALQEKIGQGYGCDRKLRNEYCQRGCQGIRFPLDNSVLSYRENIETLLEKEFSS